jgi:hypothetical protein
MSPNDSTGLENSGLAEEDATDAAVFGIDAKNRKHRFHTGTATIVVTDGDDVVHTEQLAREHVPQWIEYVRDACGWVDVWWSAKGFGEGIVLEETDAIVACEGDSLERGEQVTVRRVSRVEEVSA